MHKRKIDSCRPYLDGESLEQPAVMIYLKPKRGDMRQPSAALSDGAAVDSWRLSGRPGARRPARNVSPRWENGDERVELVICLEATFAASRPILIYALLYTTAWLIASKLEKKSSNVSPLLSKASAQI